MRKRWMGLICVAGLMLVASHGARAQGGAMKIQEGEEAPDFSLVDFQTGKKVSLKDFRGKKVVMLEFWATWCDICKQEMPRIQKEYEKYKDKGYQLVGITLSRGDAKDKDRIKALRDKHRLSYPILLDTEFEVATKLYGLSGPIPLKAIVDCAGKVRYTHVGDYADGVSEVPFVLDELLAEPSCKH